MVLVRDLYSLCPQPFTCWLLYCKCDCSVVLFQIMEPRKEKLRSWWCLHYTCMWRKAFIHNAKNPNVRFDYLKKPKGKDTKITTELAVSYEPYLFTVLPDVCQDSLSTIEAVCGLLGIFSVCRLVWPKRQGSSINYDRRDSHQLRDSALFKPDCIFYNKEGQIS